MKIEKVVIPVAGLGTRLLPATKSQPKEMLPIGRKPVVQYVVEEMVEQGLKKILFVTGRDKRSIEDHFDRDPELLNRLSGERPRGTLRRDRLRQRRRQILLHPADHPTGPPHARRHWRRHLHGRRLRGRGTVCGGPGRHHLQLRNALGTGAPAHQVPPQTRVKLHHCGPGSGPPRGATLWHCQTERARRGRFRN